MAFSKITSQDFKNKGALSLDDQPTLAPQELKRKFDEDAREVVAPAFNKLVETELPDTSAAANIGAASPTGRTVQNPTVQSVINKVSEDLATLEASAGTAIQDAHTHDNKALLDDYDQTNTDITDAVNKKHEHSNKALLDDYTQSNSDLADAVDKKHEHSNKSLLDDYTQTNADLADAVNKKHDHSNKAVLDKFSEVSGDPYYDGQPIGGGGQADAYKTIESAGTSFVASGADTFKINAGSNVTITALTGSDKGIQISATGGGSSTGDMLMSDYDSNGDVKSAGGIDAYVSGEIGKLDVSDSAVSGQYVSSVSETDGKINVTRESLPSIPTITDTYSASSHDGMSGVAVASAISGKADTSSLKDLAYIDIDGASSTKVLQGDGTWVVPSTGGHEMIPTTNDIATITALQNGNDNYVINAYSAKRWSNTDSITLLTTVAQGDDTMGTWTDTWETDGVRTGWLCHSLLADILSDNDTEIELVFDIADSETVSAYAYRIDDHYTVNGETVGGIAIKFNGAIQNASGVKVGVKLKHNRATYIPVSRT